MGGGVCVCSGLLCVRWGCDALAALCPAFVLSKGCGQVSCSPDVGGGVCVCSGLLCVRWGCDALTAPCPASVLSTPGQSVFSIMALGGCSVSPTGTLMFPAVRSFSSAPTVLSSMATWRRHLPMCFSQVAELYEELKTRISQFNMHVGPRRPVMGQEHAYKQRLVLQVCGSARLPGLAPSCGLTAVAVLAPLC